MKLAVVDLSRLYPWDKYQLLRDFEALGYFPVSLTFDSVNFSVETAPEDFALDFDNLCESWEIVESEK